MVNIFKENGLFCSEIFSEPLEKQAGNWHGFASLTPDLGVISSLYFFKTKDYVGLGIAQATSMP